MIFFQLAFVDCAIQCTIPYNRLEWPFGKILEGFFSLGRIKAVLSICAVFFFSG
jgi:hypothetical protein